MSSLRRRYKNFKKAKTNPYAGRGLDKFALVSAELEARREKLAAELGTPLSMVKFAIGSHNKWIPIILSRSTKKESHVPKKKSGALVNEEKLALSSRAQKSGLHKGGRIPLGGLIKEEESQLSSRISEDRAHGRVFAKDELPSLPHSFMTTNAAHVAGDVDRQKSQLGGSINENTALVSRPIGEDAFFRDDFHVKHIMSHTDNVFNEDGLYVDALVQKKRSSLGSLVGIDQEDSGEITETFSDSSGAEDIATYEEKAVVLQGGSMKNVIEVITGLPWVVSKASTLASSIIFLKWHAKSNASRGKTSSPERQSLRTADDFHAAAISVSLPTPPLDKAVASSHVLPLPSPPALLKIPNIPITSEQAEIVETVGDVGTPQLQTATKQHKKCKVKGLLKMRSAPSTPRDSRKPNKSFAAAGTPTNHQATDADLKQEQLLAARNHPHSVPRRSRLSKVSAADLQKERASRAGHAFAAAGIVISLSGLAMGYVSAIIGVVCWWYVLPSLRKAVGDRPMVRSHHSKVNKVASRAVNAQVKDGKVMKEVARDKYDLQSQGYKKKIIMEGLLDRGRRSSA